MSGVVHKRLMDTVTTRPPLSGPVSRVHVIDVMLPGSIPGPALGRPPH